jgi:type VI secretion system secreted protein Hcp
MPAYLKMGDIKGEVSEQDHKDWVLIEQMSAPIHRSIPAGAVDQKRLRGETTLGDVVVVRNLDKSSPKLQESCANGTFFKEVEVHFCTAVANKQEPYLKYKLSNVIVTSYSFHGNAKGDPQPTEEITMAYTAVEWTYVVIDKDTGRKSGQVAAKYNVSEGKA